MADDLAAFERKLTKLGDLFDGTAVREMTTRVAVLAKKDVGVEVVRDVGADMKMSGWKRITFRSGFELASDHEAVLSPRPSGPWSVLDGGRKRGRKYSRKAKRRVGWGPTQGHHTWERSSVVIAARTPERVHTEVRQGLSRIFTGGE